MSPTIPTRSPRRLVRFCLNRCLQCCALACICLLPAARAQGARAPSAFEMEQGARGALNTLIVAYAGNQPMLAEPMLDEAMIGRQVLLDQMRTSLNQQAQIQVSLRDVRSSIGDNVVAVTFSWEKRFLQIPAMTPVLRSGRAVFMWQRSAQGWRLVGISGDSPFAL